MADRRLVYPGQIPLEVDLLQSNKDFMIGLGYALQTVLGTSTLADGLACTPTTPASLSVNVGPGSIMSVGNIDATAYSTLAADTRSIVKQGLSLDTLTFALPAPATVGQSVVYLIEAAYQDADVDPVTLPYYNAANPSQAYSGPNNSGVAQYTTRQGKCLVQVKTGTAAPTGTQAAPTPDAGFTALYAVTVANGQTTVTSGNIAAVGAPFVGAKLTGRLSAASNLSDVASAPAAIANIGGLRAANNLSDVASAPAAIANIGGLRAANNLSDVASAPAAIANIGGLRAASNLSDVASAPAAIANIGGLRAANNLSDLAGVAAALTNLGMADSQGASGYKLLGKGLVLQWTTSPTVTAGGGLSGSWPLAMTTHLWSMAALVSSGGAGTSSSVNISNTCTGTTYDVYSSGPTAGIARIIAIGIL